MNLIDRDKLIEELSRNSIFEKVTVGEETVYDVMERLPVYGKWISCEERLPKENGCYLVTVYELDTKRKVVKTRVFKNGHFYRSHCSTIIAWQPLPPKYEE